MWVENVPQLYYPGENGTVDEQLVVFRVAVISSKLAKHDIKICFHI